MEERVPEDDAEAAQADDEVQADGAVAAWALLDVRPHGCGHLPRAEAGEVLPHPDALVA